MEKVVSVIIPVYNVSEYLPKCLDSVIAQTYKNLDIILVDDGSLDESGKICDEYAKNDSRITVIHKENGGVSSARNAALDVIKGDYVCFVDADDYVVENMLERLVEEIEKGYDVVQCGYSLLYGDTTVPAKINRLPEKEYSGKTEILKAFFEEKIVNSLWNKLFAGRVINGKMFDKSIRIAEDKLFVHSCLVDAENVKCISDELYVYVQREDSATKARLNEKYFDDIIVLNYFVDKYSSSEDINNSLMINAARVYLSLLFRISCSDKKTEFVDEYREKVLKYKSVIFGSKVFSVKEKIITHILSLAPGVAYKLIVLFLNR